MDIDLVLLWVDGNDDAWLKEKQQYSNTKATDNSTNRYRDWGLLPYYFRGVERFLPWIRMVHFVTWGHLPPWLDTTNGKLHIVKHTDFIPKEDLPTFNSNAIDYNISRIPGLAEHFIYTNDDTFFLKPLTPEFFFSAGLRVDMLCEEKLIIPHKGVMEHINDNIMRIINDNFPQKRNIIKANRAKWFCHPAKSWLHRHLYSWLPHFNGFTIDHLPMAFTKSLFTEVLAHCPEEAKATSSHRFRSPEDLNLWLMRYWSFCSGQFTPAEENMGKYFAIQDKDNADIVKAIEGQCYPMICCNDTKQYPHFDAVDAELKRAFSTILPHRSSFEKEEQ